MAGVGPVLAFTLIALFPDLGKMSRKQIAALGRNSPHMTSKRKAQGTTQHLRWGDAGP